MSAEHLIRDRATSQRAAMRYRFRDGIWEVLCAQMAWNSTTAAALALGVRDTTISRGLAGYPGERLMAAVMAAVPPTWKFEHIFELVAEQVSA